MPGRCRLQQFPLRPVQDHVGLAPERKVATEISHDLATYRCVPRNVTGGWKHPLRIRRLGAMIAGAPRRVRGRATAGGARMSSTPVDISWHVLRQIARDWAGSSTELAEVKALDGGSVSTTLRLVTAAGDSAVLKITPPRVDRAYADEAVQLDLLRDVGMPVPRVYATFMGTLDNPFSYILMEFIEGIDLAGVKACCLAEEFDVVQAELAEAVLRLHSHMSTHYMRVTHDE